MLNEIEKALIGEFLASIERKEAIRAGLLQEIENAKAPYDIKKSNEENGAEMRAFERAIELVNLAFSRLYKYEIIHKESPKKQRNSAR